MIRRVGLCHVFAGARRAGTLSKDSRFSFLYDPGAHEQDEIGLLYPLVSEPYTHGAVPPIFQVNLPEGYLKDRLMTYFSKRVERMDDLFLLAAAGRGESIGRLHFSAPVLDAEIPKEERTRPALDELIHGKSDEVFDYLINTFYLHGVVSGIQPKVLAPATERGTLGTSEWIVKKGDATYPWLAVSEWIGLEACRRMDLDVPEFRLSDDGQLLFVRRFDREGGNALGFEDFCSLTGRAASEKYEGSYQRFPKLLTSFMDEEGVIEASSALYDSLLVSMLLGNGDAHLKNFGVLYEHTHAPVRLAPVYDVLNTTAYIEGDTLALKLNGSKRWPSRSDLVKLASDFPGVKNPDERIDQAFVAILDALTDRPFANETRFIADAILAVHRRHLEGDVTAVSTSYKPSSRLSP